MTDQAAIENIPIELGPRSSVLEKTTPELRRKLDRAILNYDPPGYRALYKKYGLPELGVSFTAFYHYARKLRRRAAAADMALTALPEERDSVRLLPGLVGQCLIDQLMTGDDASPQAIYRLMLAYTAAINNAITVHEARHVFPRPSSPSGSEPRPSGSAEWPSNKIDSSFSRESQTVDSSIPHSPAPTPTNLCSSASSAEKTSDLLARADHELAAEKAALADAEARALAHFEQLKKDLTAMGYPVAHCQTHDEVDEILGTHNPVADPVPAADEDAGARIPSRTPLSGNPFRSDTATTPVEPSSSQISNLEISNPSPSAPPPPHPPSDIPLPTSTNPPAPSPSNLCPSASSAVKTSDLLTSTADDQFRITPEERRVREFHRVAIAYGMIKPDAPVPNWVESMVKEDCPTT